MLLIPADVGQVRLAAVATENGIAVAEKSDSKSFSMLWTTDQLLEEPPTWMGKVCGDVDGLKGTTRNQRNELSDDGVGRATALKETLRNGLRVLSTGIIEGKLHVQREAISIQGETGADPNLETLMNLFDHLIRKRVKGRENARTCLWEIDHPGIRRGHLEATTVAPLRGSASLEVSMRELRTGDFPDVREDISSLVGENLEGSLRRHDESIDQKAQK